MRINFIEALGLVLVGAGLFFALRPEPKGSEVSVVVQPAVLPSPSITAAPVPLSAEISSPEPEESPPTGRERLIFKSVYPEFDAWTQETRDPYDRFLDMLEEKFARPTRQPIFISFYAEKEKHLPTWGEGFFDGEIKISRKFLEKNPRKARVLIKHEIVHAYLGAGWPTWLDEGLADFLSCEDESCSAFKFPPMPGKLLSSVELRKNMQSHSRNDAKRIYTQSAFLVRHLFAKYGDSFWQDLKLRAQGSSDREQFLMCSCTEEELLKQASQSWKQRKLQ